MAILHSGLLQRALLEVLILGAACGALGVWLLHLRHAYAAESLAHAMLPGLVLASLAGVPLLLGAGGGVLVAAALIARAARDTRVGSEIAVGVTVTTAFGLGAVLALAPDVLARLGELLFGDLLGASTGDLVAAGALAAVVALALALGHRNLCVAGLDPVDAREAESLHHALGLPTRLPREPGSAFWIALARDKKRGRSGVRMVLCPAIGESKVFELSALTTLRRVVSSLVRHPGGNP